MNVWLRFIQQDTLHSATKYFTRILPWSRENTKACNVGYVLAILFPCNFYFRHRKKQKLQSPKWKISHATKRTFLFGWLWNSAKLLLGSRSLMERKHVRQKNIRKYQVRKWKASGNFESSWIQFFNATCVTKNPNYCQCVEISIYCNNE